MATYRKTSSHSSESLNLNRASRFHPYKTFLFFTLLGSTVIFLTMAYLFILTVSNVGLPEHFVLPKAFTVSTVLIMLNSFVLFRLSRSFTNDNAFELKAALIASLILTCAFCFSQGIGWMQLFRSGLLPASNNGIAFLYILSGLHLLHVSGGLIYLIVLTQRTFIHTSEIVKSLLFFTDEKNTIRFHLISLYWHFVDGVWVLLFLLFLFTLQ
ncbi:MAG TPA: hypothetical protein VFW78_01250 [Bacteroidia bacterium]|nr:hypothetical protein [Bacteroidia bacterium]